ncbi:MAG: glycosyltransferase [Clostridia bacterium]|nr:glycosyltransferase [Clostridia bacterium]
MKPKTKVLFLIQDLKHGGAEKVLVNLANNLDKTKYDVTVKTLFNKGVHIKNIKNDVTYIKGLPFEFRGNSHIIKKIPPKWLYRFFVKDKYDIVAAFLEGNATRVLSGCTDEKTKKVAWIHIEMPSIKTSFSSNDEAAREYSKFDDIICVSETVKEAFEKAANKKFENIEVLYNVNETEQIIEKSNEIIDDIKFNKDKINLISVAKMVPSKGYDRLIPVIAKLNKELNNILHLYLLGIGEQQDELEKIAKQNGASDFVTFLGFKENPYKYVKQADLYVCSSRKEGFSTAVTEALVVGTAVVSTNCSGAYELLGNNNEYGIVTDNSEEGIYNGIKDMVIGEKYKDYSVKALARGKEFSTQNTTKAVEKMFERLITNE